MLALYLGGERSDGSTGHETTGKTPFVAAVSLDDAGHPLYEKLSTAPAFASEAIGLWVTSAPCSHAMGVGSAKPKALPEFHWDNSALGNLK